jgi:hypothetical protein
MPFGSGPFGVLGVGIPTPSVDSASISEVGSSRKITAGGRYVLNDEGGFETMDDIDQRVLILVSRATGRRAKVITEVEMARMRESIRAALAKDLMKPADPDIKLRRIDVTNTRAGYLETIVEYRNLRTNTVQTAKASL